tara:strand:- start:397 stop:1575 length:1179 start_codon:yes stop_codon:yes gene_type:complete
MEEKDRYSKSQILLSEEVYDKGFQSPGGKGYANLLINNIKNDPKNILVFGCGTGGEVALLSYKYPNSSIIAVDKSSNMIDICKTNLFYLTNVTFIQNDGTSSHSFGGAEQFDLIWCRDVILYIEQKQQLLINFNFWLKYSGQLIICDFGTNNYGKEIKDYCDDKSYHLISMNAYIDILKKAEFIEIEENDNTNMFLTLNRGELFSFQENKSTFILNNGLTMYNHFVARWKQKIVLSEMNQFNYYYITCNKRKKHIYVNVACDLFHYGHSTLFKKIKEQFPNSILSVGICSDESIYKYKNKYPIFCLREREITIRDCKYVDETLINVPINTTLDFINKHNIDFVAVSNEYTDDQVKEYYPDLDEDLLYKFNYTNTISSSNTLKRIKKYLLNHS